MIISYTNVYLSNSKQNAGGHRGRCMKAASDLPVEVPKL